MAINYEMRVLQAIRRMVRATELYSRRVTGEFGLTVPQLVSLRAIEQAGAITLRDLAAEVYLTPSTLVGIVDRLEAKGLIRRKRDAEDRRKVFLHATAAGRALLRDTPSPLQDRLAAALRDLPELERSTLALSLERLVDLMEIGHVDAEPLLDRGAHLAEGHTELDPDAKPGALAAPTVDAGPEFDAGT